MKYSNTLLPLFLITACSSFNEAGTGNEIVYINNGAIQCESKGLSETETAQTLINEGIDVLKSQCAHMTGIAVATQCGLGGTNINLHTINTQNLSDAKAVGFLSISDLKNGDDPGYKIIDCR